MHIRNVRLSGIIAAMLLATGCDSVFTGDSGFPIASPEVNVEVNVDGPQIDLTQDTTVEQTNDQEVVATQNPTQTQDAHVEHDAEGDADSDEDSDDDSDSDADSDDDSDPDSDDDSDDDCEDDSDCDDDETCDDGECVDDSACDPDDCDDGDLCTEDECDDGDCDHEPVECDDGDVCNPDTGDCVDCLTDEDCDDADACTDDTCDTTHACVSTPVDCNDALFCTGTESCDPVTGDCVSSGDPCAEGEVCDEGEDECGFFVFLSDLAPISASVGYGEFLADVGHCGNPGSVPLRLAGHVYSKGLFVHANSRVAYGVEGSYDRFSAVIGISDFILDPGSECPDDRAEEVNATFLVEIDGVEVFSQDMNALDDSFLVDVDITGAAELTLRTVAFGLRGIDSRHTIWADAQVW